MSPRVDYDERAIDQAAAFLDDPPGIRAVLDAIDLLVDDPRPAGSFPYGSPDLRRLRVGRYRILHGGLQPDLEDVIGPEVPVHDPRFPCGQLALDGCPLAGRRRGQAGPPEEPVQFDHRQAGDLAEAGGEG